MSEPLSHNITFLALEYDLACKDLPGDMGAADAERECDRLLLALGRVQEEIDANQRSHDVEVQRARQWLDRVNRTPLEQRRWLLERIEAVARHVPRFGKKKSRDLPHGVVGWRRLGRRVEVVDPAETLAWAKERDLPVEVKETVSHLVVETEWKAASVHMPDFVPPRCRVVEAEERFYVEPKDVA